MSTSPSPPLAREDVSVLIAAAGSGHRLGLGPKAQLTLGGHTLEEWLVRKAWRVAGEVIVARPADAPPPQAGATACTRIEGGATRQDSVLHLARAATRPWVSLWEVSRPFATAALTRAVLDEARAGSGAACAFVPLDMPVALAAHATHAAHAAQGPHAPLARLTPRTQVAGGRSAAALQTPLGFRRELLLAAAEQAAREGWAFDSTVELVLRAGHEVGMVPGEKRNLKLTTAQDWALAQGLVHWLE